MLRQRVLLVLLVTGCASVVRANPIEDGTRITVFAGGRYVPHDHFERLARESGYPLKSAWKFGPEAMLSFSYAPVPQAEISLEFGAAADQYELPTSTLSVTSVPLVGTIRYFPFEPARLSPYLGLGGGYMLGFVSGAPLNQSETHAREYHAVVGLTFELSPRYLLSLEDRFQIASGDILPIGQIQTGGNAVMVGLSVIFAPEQPIAPHAPSNLR
jgi:hypothetical protein